MGNRRAIALLTGAALCALILLPAVLPTVLLGAQGSLVPIGERIPDAEARRELARLLSYSDAGRAEALEILQAQLKSAPQDVEARLALAELLARAGRLPEAEAALAALPAKVLAQPETQERIGEAYFAAGRMAQAAEHFGMALEGGRPVLRKLAQALAWSGDAKAARPLLEKLLAQNPADRELALLLVRLRLADGDADGAAALARQLAGSAPDDPQALAELADVETALGHAASAQALYAKALALPGGAELRQRSVPAMYLRGAFGRIIAALREQVAAGRAEDRLPLAEALLAAQRVDEAEGVLRALMLQGLAPQARLTLARLKLGQQEPAAALEALEPLLAAAPPVPETADALALAAQAQRKLGNPAEGLRLLAALPADREPALRARLLLAAGQKDQAEALLAQARKANPRDAEIAFLALGEKAATLATLDALSAPGARTPAELTAWAALYANAGQREAALRCLRAALAADAELFPARMGLAETLAADRQYDAALAGLDALAAEFSDSTKVLLTRARVLSWAKRYDEAQAAYAALSKADPGDPVPVREAARVHFWAKERDQALAAYSSLLAPPVDATLAGELAQVAGVTRDAALDSIAASMAKSAAQGSQYRRYERLSLGRDAEFSSESAPGVNRALADQLPAYRIQKAASLESRAKNDSFDTRFARALPLYGELLGFEPGNQEARFDQAQAACALGLCSVERAAYTRLLQIDPLHTLAGTALERLDRRTSPSLSLRQNIWHEAGRGELARILRQRTDLGLTVPVADDYRLGLTQHRWQEDPRGGQTAEALGQTLSLDGVFSPTLRGAAHWTNKRYTTGRLGNVDTGRARLEVNLDDRARVGFGYERAEELANAYALAQRALSDSLFADLVLTPARDWEISAEARAKSYSDNNAGDLQRLAVSYAFTDHPRQLKAILSGERRNTDKKSQELYAGATLTDIRHPYWTPQDYTATALTLEWRHDLAKLFFCGAPQHWYDLRATVGTDSENNPSVRFEAEWKYEFAERWSVEARGLVHRSRQWDAEGLWVGLGLGF